MHARILTTLQPIDARTRLAGILGYPVEHSYSPLIHNTAFGASGLNCRYVALSVPPDDLADAIRGLRALRFLGANVTLPHKQAVLPLLDTFSDTARAVGAVNTIVCQQDGDAVILRGDNTDVIGFLEPLRLLGARLHGGAMVILGAGGAARAATYGLLTTYAPNCLTLAARTLARAEQLVADLAPFDTRSALRVLPLAEAARVIRAAGLVVNTTPVGMHPQTDATPWPDARDFHAEQIVYDLIYRPGHTHLLQQAAAQGARTLGGLEMLLHQAAAAYRQWTGTPMSLDPVRQAMSVVSCG